MLSEKLSEKGWMTVDDRGVTPVDFESSISPYTSLGSAPQCF